LGGWFPASFVTDERNGLKVLLKARYKSSQGGLVESAPLAVKFPYGKGQVIFTSFHNEKQNSAKEEKLLKYLVFTVVTAKRESKMQQKLIKGGFSPDKNSLLSVGGGTNSVSSVYRCKTPGTLNFALGFDGSGADLELTVSSPNGENFSKRASSSFTLEVKNAQPGDYRLTVTAHKTPQENFPFNLTVGRK
jgi:hypothetical protein